MRHSRAIQRFAKSKLFAYVPAAGAFVFTGRKCSMQVYDRFISDRTFGTKKRILLIPGPQKLAQAVEYIRIEGGLARYMLDAIDEDQYADDPYLTSYLLREAGYVVEILENVGTGRASGSGGKNDLQIIKTLWGDYERYTASTNKADMEGVSNTVMDIFLPLSTEITSDNFIRIDGKLVDVREVSRVSNLLWVRGVRLGTDAPATYDPKHYACELAIDWADVEPQMEILVPDEATREYESQSACHSYVMPIHADEDVAGIEVHTGLGYGVEYPVDYAGVKVKLTIYKADHTLLVTSDTGCIEWDDSDNPADTYYLAAVPQIHSDPATVTLHVQTLGNPV